MIATLELEILATQRCPACGIGHQIRAVVAPDESQPAPAMLGFFGRCGKTGERVWLVVEVPDRPEGGRLVQFGPLDDETWEPEERLELPPLPRGTTNGGFRDAARTPEMLRRVWGCPFRS